MPTDFWPQAIASLMIQEGGEKYVDNPNDPGGGTRFGISLRFAQGVKDLGKDGHLLLDVDGNGTVNAADIRVLPRSSAEAVYQSMFWKPMNCPQMPGAVALAVMDCGVNQGRGPAGEMLQQALGLTADGKIGPATIAAINRASPAPLLAEYMARRALRYAGTRGIDTFGLGWMRRVISVHQYALSLCGVPKCPS